MTSHFFITKKPSLRKEFDLSKHWQMVEDQLILALTFLRLCFALCYNSCVLLFSFVKEDLTLTNLTSKVCFNYRAYKNN
ncbi:transmembrane protein, putative [Medicago truncatula]|uniref:Transmembrane protein, putative n=1 Tax=Medicago truncatula TaxID=3880 RepID=A0A072UHN8_MEDTR|nr:transmembrane protein, putative [Medicago truncatula]